MKVNYIYDDTYRGTEITADRVELVIDPDDPTTVWIYMLSEDGEREEGGSFSMVAFLEWVVRFYNENY